MEYKKYEYGNYNIHLLKTDKFKSILVSMILINDFKKESLTKNALLRRLLTTSTKDLKDETEVLKKEYDLYNSNVLISNTVYNNIITTDFSIEILEDKYTEDGLLKKALDYFFDKIFNPNILDGKFDKNNYELAVKSLNDYYDREKENKRRYAFNKACELLDDEEFKYNTSGYKEDLEKITNEDMVNYYNSLFKEASSNIFIIGSFNDDEILGIINERVNGKLYKNKSNFILNNNDNTFDLKEKVDIERNNQSNLILIYKIIDITERERNVILPVFNRILGVGNNSKLFRNVREKRSLAYDIRSTASREEALVLIEAGIDGKTKDETVKEVKEEIENLKNGNVTLEELEEAVKFRYRALKQFEDDNESILYIKINNILFSNDDLNEREEHLKTVTKEEIIALAQKLKLNVIYMLKGETKNEQD